jgi:peptidoglycan hydrolase-like protein with peptidoglycan-binding domain
MILRLLPRAATAVLVAALAVTGLALASPAAAATPTPRIPSGLPRTIEPMTDYVAQASCDPVSRPGTVQLAQLLASTYRVDQGTTWNSTYNCGTDGNPSEHYDGRAIDWMVSIRNGRQHVAGQSFVTWLLATDKAGNKFAMARRLGVMYVIYDNRIWGAWDGKWDAYNNCAKTPQRAYDNACHRTHVHISLSWNGAMGRTTFWTKKISPVDYGPCKTTGLNWAYRYLKANSKPCRSVAAAKAPKGASATKKALVAYSGADIHRGNQGPAVTAVQKALHVSATGSFGAQTTTAVKTFQRAHKGCPVTGWVNPQTWHALLAAVH